MLRIAIRIAITALLFYLIFRSIEIENLLVVIKQINPLLLLPALALQLLSTLTAAYRWYLVMHLLEFGQTVAYYIRSYFRGAFFNQALPTSIGGDAIRILDTSTLGRGKREAFYGVVVDRVVGVLGLLILNLVANLLYPDLLPREIYVIINMITLGGITGVIVLMSLRKLAFLERYKIINIFHAISERLRLIYQTRGDAGIQTSLSVIVHLLSMTAVYFIGRSVGLDYGYLTFLVLVPPAIMLTIIPISLAGWGVRESALIGLFVLIGANKTLVLSMSLIYGVLLIVASLPGLYFFVVGKHRFG